MLACLVLCILTAGQCRPVLPIDPMNTTRLYHRIRTSLCEGLAPISEQEFSRRIRLVQYLFARIQRNARLS
jgi:hypothetical protein